MQRLVIYVLISAVVQAAQNTGSVNHVESGLAVAPSSTAFTTFTSVGTLTTDGRTETGTFTMTSSRAAQATGSIGQSPGASSKSNTAVIAGGAVGGVIILTLFAAFVLFFIRRSRQNRTEEATAHTAASNTNLFRPEPGTGWDIESNRSNATNVANSTSSGVPFVEPMTQTGPLLNVQKKPVPGLLPEPRSASEDPFWDTTQGKQFEQVVAEPVKAKVDPVVTRADPFADPEKKAEPEVEKPAQDPFVDPTPTVPLQLTPHAGGPSGFSAGSSEFDPAEPKVEKPARDPFVDSAFAVSLHPTPQPNGPSRLSTASSQFDPSVGHSSTTVSLFFSAS